jgi:hypothetical protein
MATEESGTKVFGVLAQFNEPWDLFQACERVRDAGFTRWDAHSPFPVHGLERAMGLRRSRLGWVVFGCALFGAALGFGLQWWIHTQDYPLVISGKPYSSWPAFIPVTFELAVLCGALGAVLGMFHFNKLPRWHHPLLRLDRFAQTTTDGFFISIEASDPKFAADRTPEFLKEIGASRVEIAEE